MPASEFTRPQFLLLLRQPAGGPPPPEELQQIMGRFHAWLEVLRTRHEPLSSHGLAPTTGRFLRGRTVTNGPYIETNEVIGGFVLLSAEDLENATAAAAACPGLDYGMAVEVRPVL